MRNSLTILSLFFSVSTFAQVYLGQNNSVNYLVEIWKDSAKVEVIRIFRYSSGITDAEKLIVQDEKRSNFNGKRYSVSCNDKSCNLKILSTGKTLHLDLSDYSYYDPLRKEAYYADKRRALFRMRDSLSGPLNNLTLSYRPILPKNTSRNYPEYVKLIDHDFDSVAKEIISLRDTSIQDFYQVTTLQVSDTARIFKLLSTANYNFHYGKFILYHLAMYKPEILIRYIDKNPANKITLLKTIRNHPDLIAMTKSVSETRPETSGQKEILKQKRKNKAGNAAFSSAYLAIILLQIGVVVLLVRWLIN